MGVPLMIGIFLISVVVHECGHFFALKRVHGRTEEIIVGFPRLFSFHIRGVKISIGLIPLIAGVKPDSSYESKTFKEKAFVGIAGPAMTLVLTVIAWGTASALSGTLHIQRLFGEYQTNGCSRSGYSRMASTIMDGYHTHGIASIFAYLALINLILLIVNMLPIPPLDGGNLLALLLEKLFGERVKKILGYVRIAAFVLLMGFMLKDTTDALISEVSGIQSSPNYAPCEQAP